jgi:hypothetical protein
LQVKVHSKEILSRSLLQRLELKLDIATYLKGIVILKSRLILSFFLSFFVLPNQPKSCSSLILSFFSEIKQNTELIDTPWGQQEQGEGMEKN